MTVPKTLKHACQVLRRKVRYKSACLRMPSTEFPDTDTEEIRQATRIYVESWIIPIIDAIENGDIRLLSKLTYTEHGDELRSEL